MHSTLERAFDEQAQNLVDFGTIASQPALLAGPQSSQNVDVTATFASLSDEDVENLMLLAHYCSSYLDELNEGFGESGQTLTLPDSSIPIATPVPLPYSARTSEVLESMISGPKETLAHTLTLAEKLEREHAKSPDSVLKMQTEERDTKHGDSIQPTTENNQLPQVFRPIRPVSPSTLIALTEPCLMAWSTRLPLKPLPAQDLHATASTRQGVPVVTAPTMHSEPNRWGY